MFCTFIFAVLLLNTAFLLVISYKDIVLQIFLAVTKLLITVTYNLMADISYIFVTIAMGVDGGEMRLPAFNGPSPKTPL